MKRAWNIDRGYAFQFILGLTLLSMGCVTRRVDYRPDYLPDVLSPGLSAPGRALLLVEPADEAYVFRGRPNSFHAGGVTMEMPLGRMVCRSAERIFNDLFEEGCIAVPRLDSNLRYTALIHVKPMSYEYAFNQIRNLTLALTPQVRLSIRVRILDSNRHPLFEEVYDSGTVNDETVLDTLHPNETINRHTHRVLASLLARAAADLRTALDTAQTRVHPPPPTPLTELELPPIDAPPETPAPPPAADPPRARLERLKKLFDEGLITREVYEAKQKEILADY